MRVLDITLNVLAVILGGLILWAIWPWLIQVLHFAQYVHNCGL